MGDKKIRETGDYFNHSKHILNLLDIAMDYNKMNDSHNVKSMLIMIRTILDDGVNMNDLDKLLDENHLSFMESMNKLDENKNNSELSSLIGDIKKLYSVKQKK